MKLINHGVLLLTLLFFSSTSYSQYGLGYTKKDLVKNTELIVIIDYSINSGDLRAAFEKAWTYNSYRLLSRGDVKDSIDHYKGNKKYSFLHFRDEYESVGNATTPTFLMSFFNRVMIISFSITKDGKPGVLPILTALASTVSDSLMSTQAELVKDLWFLQQQLNTPDPSVFFKPQKVIVEKTLLIPKAIVYKKTEEELKKIYPYKFKLATPEEISEAILNKTPNTVIMDLAIYPTPILTYTDVNTEKVVFQSNAQGLNGYFERNLEYLLKRLNQ